MVSPSIVTNSVFQAMESSVQRNDMHPKKHKADYKPKSLFSASHQALPPPLAWRYQGKSELLVRGQKPETKGALLNLPTLMDQLVGIKLQPGNQMTVECSEVETGKKQPKKPQHSRSSSFLHPARNTLKLPKVPAITLSLVESSGRVSVPPAKKPPRGSLQLPKSRKSPCESDGSPNSVSYESFSAAASSVANSPLNRSLDFNEAKAGQHAGIWQSWASHLTPCHRLLDLRPPKQSQVHPYLLKLPKLHRKNSQREQLDLALLRSTGKEREQSAHCNCRNPFLLRNLRLLVGREVDLEGLAMTQRKTCSLQQIIKSGVVDPATPVLLIHLEGVLVDICKPCVTDRSPLACFLRPGAIEGLKELSKCFAIVILSDTPKPHCYKVMELLIHSKVHIYAAYVVLKGSEDLYTEQVTAAFQDYAQVVNDLGITEEAAQRVLLLSALRAESENELFSQTGLRVRLHSLHLPVALPGSSAPIVTVLVPHMRLKDTALKFTVVAQELLRLFCSSHSLSNIEDSFLAISKQSPMETVSCISTRKVHEAYYSYLLSQVHCTNPNKQTEHSLPPHCKVHPDSEFITCYLPESHFVIFAPGSAQDQGCCEVKECEFYSSKAKFSTLLEYVQSSESLA